VPGARQLDPSRPFPWRAALILMALSILADVDVLAFRFGIPYSAPFGHRGATHSLVFAVVVGSATALLLARCERRSFRRAAIVACLVAISHPLLDAMTDGGLGVALLWPFSNARFFAPWRPIPVAPIGTRMFSSRGLHVVLVEALWSLPVLIWAAWPRQRS
jgi:inner membrane protein